MILVWKVKLKPLNFGTLMISVYWSQAKMDLWKQISLECNSAAVPESLRKIYMQQQETGGFVLSYL